MIKFIAQEESELQKKKFSLSRLRRRQIEVALERTQVLQFQVLESPQGTKYFCGTCTAGYNFSDWSRASALRSVPAWRFRQDLQISLHEVMRYGKWWFRATRDYFTWLSALLAIHFPPTVVGLMWSPCDLIFVDNLKVILGFVSPLVYAMETRPLFLAQFHATIMVPSAIVMRAVT